MNWHQICNKICGTFQFQPFRSFIFGRTKDLEILLLLHVVDLSRPPGHVQLSKPGMNKSDLARMRIDTASTNTSYYFEYSDDIATTMSKSADNAYTSVKCFVYHPRRTVARFLQVLCTAQTCREKNGMIFIHHMHILLQLFA